MGYTHYWNHEKVTDDQWERVCEGTKKLVRLAMSQGIKVAFELDQPDVPPEITKDNIRFNGVDEDGHETFVLTRSGTDFDFCKTERKPYDTLVVAILCLAENEISGFSWRSDGDPEDHEDGRELLQNI